MANSGNLEFTVEQIEAMEIVFAQFPNPSAAKIREIKRVFPVLNSLDDTQIKIWFRIHRFMKRQMEGTDAQTMREVLTRANNMLNEEHSMLMRQVQELVSENAFLKQQLMMREDEDI